MDLAPRRCRSKLPRSSAPAEQFIHLNHEYYCTETSPGIQHREPKHRDTAQAGVAVLRNQYERNRHSRDWVWCDSSSRASAYHRSIREVKTHVSHLFLPTVTLLYIFLCILCTPFTNKRSDTFTQRLGRLRSGKAVVRNQTLFAYELVNVAKCLPDRG